MLHEIYETRTHFPLLKCNSLWEEGLIIFLFHFSVTVFMFRQGPKLSMHPAPGVHIFRAGCTIFKVVHPDSAHFFSHLSLLHIRRVHGEVPGCTVFMKSKSLISDIFTTK